MGVKQEPIVIVGMSRRFPGKADNPKGFYKMLARSECTWSKLPKSRFDTDVYYHPSIERDSGVSHRPRVKIYTSSRILKIYTKFGSFPSQDVSEGMKYSSYPIEPSYPVSNPEQDQSGTGLIEIEELIHGPPLHSENHYTEEEQELATEDGIGSDSGLRPEERERSDATRT
ncbi:hypothetical protein V8E51_012915 [Hyaloscypha variabilis]